MTDESRSTMPLVEEMERAAEAPGMEPSVRDLLHRCRKALSASGGDDPWVEIVRHELESVALMIEAEPVVWPEDVDRFKRLAARVRARMP